MIRLRRLCAKCSKRWTTFELSVTDDETLHGFHAAMRLSGELATMPKAGRLIVERLIALLSRQGAMLEAVLDDEATQ